MEHKSNNHIWPWAIDETRDVNAEMRRACWMYQKRFNVAPTLVISAPGLALQPIDGLRFSRILRCRQPYSISSGRRKRLRGDISSILG